MKPQRIVIAGGGTGGHLYPGIAVAREMRRRLPELVVTFAGTDRGIERTVVPREGFELDLLRSAGLKGMSIGSFARGVSLLPLSGLDAWGIVSRRKPNLVIGVGGYSSGPVVLRRGAPAHPDAAPGAERRSWLHEPDARAVRDGCGSDVRVDAFLLRKEGICHRQPGTSRVL